MPVVARLAACSRALREERGIASAKTACWTCWSRSMASECHSSFSGFASRRIVPMLSASNTHSPRALVIWKGLVETHGDTGCVTYACFRLFASELDGETKVVGSGVNELFRLRLVTNESGLIFSCGPASSPSMVMGVTTSFRPSTRSDQRDCTPGTVGWQLTREVRRSGV